MKKTCLFFFVVYITSTFSQNHFKSDLPERIILNLTAEPSNSISITWQTKSKAVNPSVQISKAKPWINFEENVKTFVAKTEEYITDEFDSVFCYSSTVAQLLPNSNYVYKVGSDSIWSEWNQFSTADTKKTPFKFVYLGDPQNDLKEYCSRVFREAFKKAPDAKFWLISGDLVTDAKDKLWEEFFYAAGFIFRIIPLVAAPGNHDHKIIEVDGKQRRSQEIATTWTSHFTLPENGLNTLKETNYYIDYQGVRFVFINSQTKVDEQAIWLDGLLSENHNKWTIVSFHHPIYSATSERNDKTTRETFQPIFDKYNVDLVLNGHDHTYARSKKIKNGKPVGFNEQGTIYVVSVSGPKAYPINNKFDDFMEKTGNEIQLYQVIEINEDKIFYNSYTVDGQLYDSFEIIK